jgi:hypothetical protein
MGKGHENIIPPKKGEIRNPNGRPKGSLNSKTILKRFLEITKNMTNPLNEEVEDMSMIEIMHLKQIANAINGDLSAYKEILDRYEGKVTQQIDTTTKGESLNTTLSVTQEQIDKFIDKL